MNITLITAEEQKHYENCQEIEINLQKDARLRIYEAKQPMPDILRKTLEEPAPYVLLILDPLQEKKFYESEEAYSRLNRENAEGRGHAFFEYNKTRNTYILLECSANRA